MSEPVPANRLDRRKARTRAALIAAARELIARDGGVDASIQEITDLADVGFGSFYNHFPTKAELFEAAVDETLEEHGALLDEITAGIEDSAEIFAASVRLTVRLYKTHRQIAQIMANTGPAYLKSGSGLAPRALTRHPQCQCRRQIRYRRPGRSARLQRRGDPRRPAYSRRDVGRAGRPHSR